MRGNGISSGTSGRFAFEAFGVRVGIEVPSEVRSEVIGMLPPGWQACEESGASAWFRIARTDGGQYQVTRDGAVVSAAGDRQLAVVMLDSRVRVEIARGAPGRTFVHAGVVAVDGRTIVLPGASYAGKSTLVAALIARGAVYLSDEYAVVDDLGYVHPYPRSLSIRAPDARRTDRPAATHDVPAESFGASTARCALPVAVVALVTYRPGGSWNPQPMTPARGLVAVMEHALTARDAPASTLSRVRRMTESAELIVSDRGEADDAAAHLLTRARPDR